MVVQTPIDEQKFISIKQNVQGRPNHMATTPRTRELAFSRNIATSGAGSSDDVDSLYDQSTNYTDRTSSPSIPRTTISDKYRERNFSTKKSNDSLSNLLNQTNQKHMVKQDVDCASVTSSEWGAESEKGEPSLPRRNASIKRK
jgi:hypothetical protein